MKRSLVAFGTMLVVSMPFFAAADTSNNQQLVGLYAQLVQVLQQEINLITNSSHAWLEVDPSIGSAPLSVVFILYHPSQTEAVDFGDGHSTGSNGCIRNTLGWCDLSRPIGHQYLVPGTYVVSLWDHLGNTPRLVGTYTVTATR